MSIWKKWLTIGLFGLLAVILVVALCWRFWAHPLSRFLPLEQKEIDRISVACIWDPPESGEVPLEPNLEAGTVAVSAGQPGYAELLDILDRSRFQQDFRNLLPWQVKLSAGINEPIDLLDVRFMWEDNTADGINFWNSGLAEVDIEKGGFLFLHPVDSQTFQELSDWFFQYRTVYPPDETQ